MTELTAEKAADIAGRQWDSCEKFKQERLAKILEMQEAIYGKFRPTPRGRSGIPMPFFSKYVNELKARRDDAPTIKIGHTKDSQILLARKIQGSLDIDRSPSEGDWGRVFRQADFMEITSGISVYDYHADSTPGYESHLEAVDVNDFGFEPTGGNDLEAHAGVGKGNIFRSESELWARVSDKTYLEDGVKRLISNSSGDKYKTIQKQYLNRYERFKALGLDIGAGENNYIGESQYPLVAYQIQIGGQRYYILFDQITRIPIRFAPLKKVFKSNLYSMVLAQTHEDPHTVLSKSAGDDMWPISEWLRVRANYFIDRDTKSVWGQTIYDPNFFPDPSQLEWSRPDQLIIGNSYQGKPLRDGFVQITTPDESTVSINIMQYFENILASLAGVSPAEPSLADQKVGVLFGNLQKVSALLGVQNKSKSEAIHKITTRYIWGLKEHMDEKRAVKIMGERGAEWEEFAKNELVEKSDFEIEIVGANVELEMSEAKKKKQSDYINGILGNPEAIKETNVRVLLEEGARSAGFDESTVRRIMSKETYESERIVSHASMAIEQVLKGKTPELYRGADVSFLKYINDYVTETDLKDDKAIALIKYGQAHMEIVARNMAIKASLQLSQQGITPNQIKQPQENAQPQNQNKTPVKGAPVGAVPSNPVQ